jgi:Polyketide cyclase / dehydrase and lipid transport
MLKIIAIALVVIIAAVLLLATRQPDTFRVERSIVIDAPPEKVVAHIDDFHEWQRWSPFEKIDPAMKKTHSGAAKGKGAVYAWEGNMKAGAGRMEIVQASASNVTMDLHFLKPFEARNVAEFRLEPQGAGATKVTWSIHGPNLFVSKVMGLFMSMDKMLGKDFEEGLAKLKSIAEAKA